MKKMTCLFVLCSLLMCGCGQNAPEELSQEKIDAYAAELSQSPTSGEFNLNGVKYQLPLKIQAFLDQEWEIDGIDEEVPAYSITPRGFNLNYKGGALNSIRIFVRNDSGDKVKLAQCDAYEITIENKEDGKSNLVLPKGITLASSYDDIIKAYGEPDSNHMEDMKTIFYLDDSGIQITIQFQEDKSAIKEVDIKVL